MADRKEQIKAYFKKLDKNGDGTLTREEIREVFDDWDDRVFDSLLKGADKNEDDIITYDEFVDWVMAQEGNEDDLSFITSQFDSVKARVQEELKKFQMENTNLSNVANMFKSLADMLAEQAGNNAGTDGKPSEGSIKVSVGDISADDTTAPLSVHLTASAAIETHEKTSLDLQCVLSKYPEASIDELKDLIDKRIELAKDPEMMKRSPCSSFTHSVDAEGDELRISLSCELREVPFDEFDKLCFIGETALFTGSESFEAKFCSSLDPAQLLDGTGYKIDENLNLAMSLKLKLFRASLFKLIMKGKGKGKGKGRDELSTQVMKFLCGTRMTLEFPTLAGLLECLPDVIPQLSPYLKMLSNFSLSEFQELRDSMMPAPFETMAGPFAAIKGVRALNAVLATANGTIQVDVNFKGLDRLGEFMTSGARP